MPRNAAQTFPQVCEEGYSALGRTGPTVPEDTPWQYGAGRPPSYEAFGRLRFLHTLELAERLAPKKLLEVAAGDGFLSACLVEPGREVTINDLRLDAHAIRRWTTGDQLKVLKGDLFKLDPKTSGQFDVVMACDVIEHIAHGDRFLAHLKSFLAPGGKLLLTTPNGAYFRSKLPTYSQIADFAALESKQFRPDADGHLYLYTPAELTRLLESLGFTNVSTELYATPWISGHAGFRFLPRARALTSLYRGLDSLTRFVPGLCAQLAVVCTNGGPRK